MARTIWKYTIPFFEDPSKVIELPKGWHFLDAQSHGNDSVDIWVEVDPERKEKVTRYFQLFGTGQAVPEDATYLRTCVFPTVFLVLHLYIMDEEECGQMGDGVVEYGRCIKTLGHDDEYHEDAEGHQWRI